MMTSPRADVAVIGLGAIGLPVAINAAMAGFRVQVWNRNARRTVAAVHAGATVADSPGDIDAPIVLSVLPDASQLDEVLTAGLEGALRPGDVLVVMSTVSPVAMTRLAARLAAAGVHVIDAPVSGGDVGAQQGTLSIMVGGAAEDLEQCRSVLESVGSRIEHMGALGTGQMAKACNQVIVGATLAAIGEALTIGRAAGLRADQLLDVLGAGMAGSRAMEIKREKYLSGDFTPGGNSANQLKDLRIALDAASSLGCPLPLTSVVTGLYQRLADSGRADLDHSAIVLTTEEGLLPN